MSLINDALKRAKAAQQDTPVEVQPGPPMRTVETDVFVRHGVGLVVPIALATTALLILFFVWRYAPREKADQRINPAGSVTEARARSLPPTEVAWPAAPAAVPGATPGGAVPKAPAAPPDPSRPVAAPVPAALPSTQAKPVLATASTNSPATVALPPPQPVQPRLQGIVFDPRRPSAVINGKTLFRGDRVAGFRVVAIGRETVTLVNAGQTNVLSLEE